MKPFSILLLLLATAYFYPVVNTARAGDNPKSRESVEANLKSLREQKATAQRKLEKARIGGGSEELITSLEAEVESIDRRIGDASGTLRFGTRVTKDVNRKYRKIDKKFENIEEAKAAQVKARAAGDTEEVERLDLIIKDNERAINNKESSIAKKREKYQKRFYEKMPGKHALPDIEAPVIPESKIEPTLTNTQKKEIEGCWDLDSVQTKEFYVFYPLGGNSVQTSSKIRAIPVADDQFTRDLESQIPELSDMLRNSESGKISNLEVTSYASKVRGRKGDEGQKALSTSRNENALRAFNTLLLLNGHINAGLKTGNEPKEFKQITVVPDQPEIGNPYTGDLAALSKKKVPESSGKARWDIIRKYATMIKNNGDPTPVKKSDESSVEDIMKELEKCCATSEATLKYQPYQYSKITATLPKFSPNLSTCVKDQKKVSTNTGEKQDEIIRCISPDDNACNGIPASPSNTQKPASNSVEAK